MNDGGYFKVSCPVCGWTGSSKDAAGGGAIADTGDYDDIYCPKCIKHEKRVVLDDVDDR